MTHHCRTLMLVAVITGPMLLGSCRSADGLVRGAYRAAATAPASATAQVTRFVGRAPGSVNSTVGRTVDTLRRTVAYQTYQY